MVQKHTTAAFYDRNATVTDQETLSGNTLRRFCSRRRSKGVLRQHFLAKTLPKSTPQPTQRPILHLFSNILNIIKVSYTVLHIKILYLHPLPIMATDIKKKAFSFIPPMNLDNSKRIGIMLTLALAVLWAMPTL